MNRWILLKLLIGLPLAAGLLARTATGQAAAEKNNASAQSGRSLDEPLLGGLDDQLLEGLGDPPAPGRSAVESTENGSEQRGDAGQSPAGQLPAGEDVQPGSSGSPLVMIARRMRTVEQRIRAHDTSSGTQQLQQQIVADLETLIQQTSNRSSAAAAQKAGSQAKSPSNSPQQSSARAGRQPGKAAAQQSTEQAESPAAGQGTPREGPDPLQGAWGHLPEQIRQQMQAASVEQFLPKYRHLIEQYYQSLAEEDWDRQ